jgi:hypothetical protein
MVLISFWRHLVGILSQKEDIKKKTNVVLRIVVSVNQGGRHSLLE